jgi:hypothetical protein
MGQQSAKLELMIAASSMGTGFLEHSKFTILGQFCGRNITPSFNTIVPRLI